MSKSHLFSLREQGYTTVHQVATINIEDLEDTGFYRLGHQKRLVRLNSSTLITGL